MGKTTTKTTAGTGIAAHGLNDVVFGLREISNGGEVRKDLRQFHKDLAVEVQNEVRAEALRQRNDGGAVPKRAKGSTGYRGGGTDKTAHLDLSKANKFGRNLEFGRKYQFIPGLIVGPHKEGPKSRMSKTQRGIVGRGFIDEQGKSRVEAIGSFYPAEKMKRRVYKEWVGDFWTARGGFPEGTKYGGYVAEKTIARIVPGLSEDYSERIADVVKRAVKGKK